MTNINYGKIAWDAYAESVGGKTFDDKPLPTWEELGNRQRIGWQAAATTIVNTVIDSITANLKSETT